MGLMLLNQLAISRQTKSTQVSLRECNILKNNFLIYVNVFVIFKAVRDVVKNVKQFYLTSF